MTEGKLGILDQIRERAKKNLKRIVNAASDAGMRADMVFSEDGSRAPRSRGTKAGGRAPARVRIIMIHGDARTSTW